VSDATATAAAPASPNPPSTPARPARAPRRAPSDLTFTLDDAVVESWAAGEPDWLAADRRAALARYRELPIETNQLYTTYVDLRIADLAEVRAWGRSEMTPGSNGVPAPGGETRSDRSTLPDGIDAFASLTDGRVDAVSLSD